MSYLLGITVGPVQSYIEESRKLKDLHNSSKILSQVMINMIEWIESHGEQYKVIYPNLKRNDRGVIEEESDCSNYAIFEIDELIIDMDKLKSQATQNIKGMESYFDEVFHLFWGIEEIQESKEDVDSYYTAYIKLNNLIRSIKNTYTFKPYFDDKNHQRKKCILCGKRNIVNNIDDLCELCTFKRQFRNKSSSFESVYKIAVANWEKKNINEFNELKEKLDILFREPEKYYNLNNTQSAITTLYGTSRIHLKKKKELENELNQQYKLINKSNLLDKLKQDLQMIEETMIKLYKKIGKPNSKYAFIQFDIDDLGKWMNGYYLDEKENNLKEHQEKVSRLLIDFGFKLKEKLKDTCQIIYAGGDDFLAILPEENIFIVLNMIEQLFLEEVRATLDKEENILEKMTYTTSVTIAPCQDPMGEAIRKSREELSNAKQRFDRLNRHKNGIALTYTIRGGKEITCYLKKERVKDFELLMYQYQEIKNSLSTTFIQKFQQEMMNFSFNEIDDLNQLSTYSQLIQLELKRLVKRSISNSVDKDKVETYIDSLLDFIKKIISENCFDSKKIDMTNILMVLTLMEKLGKINFVGGEGNGIN